MSDDDKEKAVAESAKKSLDDHDEAAAAADAHSPQSTRAAVAKAPEPPHDAKGTGDERGEHEEEHLVAEADRVSVGVIGLVTTVIMIAVAFTVIGVYSFFGQVFRGEVDKKQNSVVDPQLREVRAMEEAHWGKYQWIDQSKGIVRIPKDRAKELVLADYAKMAAYQPGTVAPTSPEPAMSAAPAASGSASAMPAASGSASAAPSASAPHHDAPAPSPSGAASAPKAPAPKK